MWPRVHVTPLHATAHTGAAFAAVAQAGGVDRALGAGEFDVHRHAALVVRLFGLGLDIDGAEVIQLGQRLAQSVKLAFVVVAAFVPVHQRVEQAIAEVVVVEAHLAHVVAAAAVPIQIDVGRMLGTRDRNAALGEVGIEVATLGQTPGDADLAGFVLRMAEDLAFARLELLEILAQIAVLLGPAGDGDMRGAHPHRLATIHRDHHGHFVAGAWCGQRNGRRVIAKRLQRLTRLPLGLCQQIFQTRLALLLAHGLIQRQGDLDVLDHLGVVAVVQPLDFDLVDGCPSNRLQRNEQGAQQEKSKRDFKHLQRIPSLGVKG